MCQHLSTESRELTGARDMCAAYPDGIPSDFYNGITKHTELVGDEAEPVSFVLNPRFNNLYQKRFGDVQAS